MASIMTKTPWKRALPFACCKIYVSVNPSTNAEALEKIEAAARSQPEAPLLHVFEDHEYSRVGYTLAGSLLQGSREESGLLSPLQIAVTEAVEAALESLDLRQHCGSHPRLGAVDHISLHPLGGVALQEVAPTARAIAQAIGSNFKVPVFLYGAVHATGRPLDEIRRALGYFKPSNEQGLWTGPSSSSSFPSHMQPDFGPRMQTAKTGVVIVGACPWIMNFNVPLLSQDLAAARRISRKLSFRGGGLPQVQAMALRHGEAEIEIACNLLDCQVSDPDLVQREVIRLAATESIEAKQGYTTGFTEDEVLKTARDKMPSHIQSFAKPQSTFY